MQETTFINWYCRRPIQEGWGQSWSVYNPAGATITDTNTNDIINAQILQYIQEQVTMSLMLANGATIQDTDLNNIQLTITNGYNARTTAQTYILFARSKRH